MSDDETIAGNNCAQEKNSIIILLLMYWYNYGIGTADHYVHWNKVTQVITMREQNYYFRSTK